MEFNFLFLSAKSAAIGANYEYNEKRRDSNSAEMQL
jgi:hypothetical protein